jgi:hypothetical protein
MKKRRILYPVVALLVAGLVLVIVVAMNRHSGFIRSASRSIGGDLIRATNSTHLVRVGPHLRAQLSQLLGKPTQLTAVLLGDAPSPQGDGRACSRVVLANAAGRRLSIRLRQADRSGMFEVLGFRVLSE